MSRIRKIYIRTERKKKKEQKENENKDLLANVIGSMFYIIYKDHEPGP